jgi:hypothetical protein
MNKVIILLLLCAAGASLQAQTLARYTASDNRYQTAAPVSPLYRQAYEAPLKVNKFSIPGEKKKKVGSTMTALGGALIIGGIAVYASGDSDYYRETYNQSTNTTTVYTVDPKRVLGVLMMVAGTGVAVPGILIWSKGAKQYNRYMEEQSGVSLHINGPNGPGLSYRF